MRSVNRRDATLPSATACYDVSHPSSAPVRVEELTTLTEDSLLFDGPQTTYGRFRVLHQIGAGSVGPVFRGEDPASRRPVVIKVIRVGLTPERVVAVAAALAATRERLAPHPAVAPLLDTGVRDVEPYFVTDFVEGDSLDVALREFGPAHMRDALPRLRALADALDTAAAMGIAHGSLHLRDIVVSPEVTVLTGLGIAPALERVGVRPPVRRPYCAPEVAAGHGISPAADQYALAAIAHEWLSGRRIAGPGAEGFHVPATSPQGTEAMAAVFCRALDESPEARFPTATAFIEALGLVGDAAPPRPRSSVRRKPVEAPRLAFDVAAEDAAVPADRGDTAPLAMAFAPAPPDDVVAALEGASVPPRDDDDTLGAIQPVADGPESPEMTSVLARGDDPEGDPVVPTDEEVVAAEDETLVVPSGPREWGADDTLAAGVADRVAFDEIEPARHDEPETDDESPAYWKWAVGIAAALLLVTLGGRTLVRWGTPARTAPAVTQAAAPAGGPDIVALPPASPTPAAATPSASSRRTPGASPAASASAPTPAPSAAPAAVSPLPDPVGETPTAPAAAAPERRAPVPPRTAPAAPATPRPSAPPAKAPAATRPALRQEAPARPAAAGRLLVRSTPGGAEVFINGTRRGVTPLAMRDLGLGTYSVRVTRAGYAASEQRVTLDAGRPSRAVEVTLSATRAAAAAPVAGGAAATGPGSLVVDSRPPGARVFVDGKEAGVTPVTIPNLGPGEHTVRLQMMGFLPINTTALVTAGARARLGVSLTSER